MSQPGCGQDPFDGQPPVGRWNEDLAKRALDELFTLTQHYRSSREFHSLMQFIARFRFYSPFNGMLVHIQMPDAQYVAPASRWLRDFRRRIRAGARPLVILQPKGPVMFVFDVSDTSPDEGAPPLPREVTNPFEVRRGRVNGKLGLTVHNAGRDGVEVTERDAGSQSAGAIRTVRTGRTLTFTVPKRSGPEVVQVPLRYELLLNRDHSAEARYATLAHELGHLCCGHLGTPDDHWWPDRRGLAQVEMEFEAESVCYLVCGRLGIDSPSEQYLAGYLEKDSDVPSISLECAMKAAGLVERMGRESMSIRKPKE